MEFPAIVAYDWEASDPSEMSVVSGQMVLVQSVNDRGWALAVDETTGQSGWVPNDYLQPLDEQEVIEEVPIQQQQPPQQQEQQQEQYSQQDIHNAMSALSMAAQPQQQQQQPQQQQMQQQQQQSGSGEPCGGCGRPIDASALIAKGKHFHPDCFLCTTCQKPLTGGFLEREGKFYCEEDYYRTQGHICAHCNQAIIGSHILGNNKPYHVDHLLCTECGVSIGTDILHVKDDKNICHNCYNTKFASICATCNQPIDFQIFSALDKSYHKECFICTEGGHPMPDESFHVHEGQIYCPDHYKKLFSKPCHGCKQDISGQYLEVVGHYFHSACWKCTMCSALLESSGCALKNEQFYCPACVVKVPSNLAPTPRASQAPSAPSSQAPKPQAPSQPAPSSQAPKPTTTTSTPSPQPTSQPTTQPTTTQSNPGLRDTLHQGGDENLSIEEMRRRLLEVSERALLEASKSKEVVKLPLKDTYTHSELINNDVLPDEVDRSKKETYLTDDDFVSLFKMDKAKFATLQKWKQNELKKGAGIF